MNTESKRRRDAFMSENLFEQGIGHVVVSRFKPSGLVEVGVFLLDVYCLGVKNAFYTQVIAYEYENVLLAQVFPEGDKKTIEPCCGRKLVEDACKYAQSLGIAPHSSSEHQTSAEIRGILFGLLFDKSGAIRCPDKSFRSRSIRRRDARGRRRRAACSGRESPPSAFWLANPG